MGCDWVVIRPQGHLQLQNGSKLRCHYLIDMTLFVAAYLRSITTENGAIKLILKCPTNSRTQWINNFSRAAALQGCWKGKNRQERVGEMSTGHSFASSSKVAPALKMNLELLDIVVSRLAQSGWGNSLAVSETFGRERKNRHSSRFNQRRIATSWFDGDISVFNSWWDQNPAVSGLNEMFCANKDFFFATPFLFKANQFDNSICLSSIYR